MYDISIIIVNYNVKYHLEACLLSVISAIQNVKAEVIIVDNNSKDGSCEYIKKHFPQFQLIENKVNLGFAKANNMAIKLSTGRYVLLLNPDTIVAEDTFEKCIQFMTEHTNAGALGVHMIDGTGKYLPESKRALPTPLVSFYKAFGISAIFPKSRYFGRYHLGFLDKNKTHDVEILSGAFMMLKRSVTDEIGLLDEDYFMYGEDIDLSYRVILAGYTNHYLSTTKIIHFKGESTKKGSLNYVKIFYSAMEIFARKHFTKKRLSLYYITINSAIYFRASLAILSRFAKTITRPFINLSKLVMSTTTPHQKQAKVLLVGLKEEAHRLEKILNISNQPTIVQSIEPKQSALLNDMVSEKQITHVVFSLSSGSYKEMIEQVEQLRVMKVKISYLIKHSDELIGS